MQFDTIFYILKQIIPVWDADWSLRRSICAIIHNITVCQTRDTVSAVASPVTKQDIRFLLAGKIWSPVCWQAGLVSVDLWAGVRENAGRFAVSQSVFLYYSQPWPDVVLVFLSVYDLCVVDEEPLHLIWPVSKHSDTNRVVFQACDTVPTVLCDRFTCCYLDLMHSR